MSLGKPKKKVEKRKKKEKIEKVKKKKTLPCHKESKNESRKWKIYISS